MFMPICCHVCTNYYHNTRNKHYKQHKQQARQHDSTTNNTSNKHDKQHKQQATQQQAASSNNKKQQTTSKPKANFRSQFDSSASQTSQRPTQTSLADPCRIS